MADVETREGIISIDCDVRIGEKTEVLFILNGSTLAENPGQGAGDFRLRLERGGETLLETARTDAEAFITDTLEAAYGPGADITLAGVDTD